MAVVVVVGGVMARWRAAKWGAVAACAGDPNIACDLAQNADVAVTRAEAEAAGGAIARRCGGGGGVVVDGGGGGPDDFGGGYAHTPHHQSERAHSERALCGSAADRDLLLPVDMC